jgi:hypothetical protein
MIKTSFLIPFHHGDALRLRDVMLVLDYYLKHSDDDSEVVLCEQGTWTDFSHLEGNSKFIYVNQKTSEKFNKSSCWNFGFKNTRGENIVGVDADIIVPSECIKTDYIEMCLDNSRLFYPFDKIIDMSDLETRMFAKHPDTLECFDLEKDVNNKRSGTRCTGGIWFIKRTDFVAIGGFNTQFKSWGGEDDIFNWISTSLFGKDTTQRSDGVCFHLFHNISNTLEYKESDEYKEILKIRLDIMANHFDEVTTPRYCKTQKFLNGLVGYDKQTMVR